MKRLIAIIFVVAVSAASALAQEKGVDTQNGRIRDEGNNRAPANNGTKTDVGAGRGMDFGRGRTVVPPPIPNPYKFSTRRDEILKAVMELMRDRKLIPDEAASKPDEGIVVTQPYTFIKGAVVTESELVQYAVVPEASSRGWTRGRYTMIVELQPVDGQSTNVSVSAKVEGRTDGASGAEWVTLQSTGVAEQEFLRALIEQLTGGPPPGY
ncbi:MAG TPA: hypothetical protein VF544_22020 [Pyrinomonadaceae bacterium]